MTDRRYPRRGQWSPLIASIALIALAAVLASPVMAADAVRAIPIVSADDPFTAYDAQLNDAASQVLGRAREPEPATTQHTGQESEDEPSLSQPASLPSAVERVEKLRPMLEPILREVGVPTALTSVVLVESGGESTALSPKGARGLWQLMPDTARRYGLTVTSEQDERLDIVKSTRAAARYLRDLYGQFGNWPLALAAYNAGELTVERMLDRTPTKTFSNLSRLRLLPEETRNYVPAVLSSVKLLDRGADLRGLSTARSRPSARVVYADSLLEN